MIYRSASSSLFLSVVIAVDGSLSSSIAVKLGLSLALQHDIAAKQLHVQEDYHYNPDNEDTIRAFEAQMPLEQGLSKQIVAGPNPRREILQSLTRDDLLVVGFSQKSDFERQVTDDLSNQLLNTAPGPVILISQIEWHRGWRGMIEHGLARLNPQLTLVEQNELIWNAEKNAYGTLDYTVMIVLSERQITPEEVESAHLLIYELYGEDVDVKVIAREIVRPTTPRSAQVAAVIGAAFPNHNADSRAIAKLN